MLKLKLKFKHKLALRARRLYTLLHRQVVLLPLRMDRRLGRYLTLTPLHLCLHLDLLSFHRRPCQGRARLCLCIRIRPHLHLHLHSPHRLSIPSIPTLAKAGSRHKTFHSLRDYRSINNRYTHKFLLALHMYIVHYTIIRPSIYIIRAPCPGLRRKSQGKSSIIN